MLSSRTRAASFLAIALALAGAGLHADAPAATAAGTAAATPAAGTAPTGTAAQVTTPVPAGPAPWVLGIARFSVERSEDPRSSLEDTLPLLILSDLKSLPKRHTPDAAAAEAAFLAELRSRFTLGTDLASKLDARALRFFDPILDMDAWKDAISAADKQVSTAEEKLEAAKENKDSASTPPPKDLVAKLWDGHENGQLIDSPTLGLSQAAKAAKVDLLVTGSVAIQSGYAVINVQGYDASLDREVFSWKSYCAIDDPGPLAADIAERLENWTAGRPLGRLEVNLNPASAELSVDGEPFEGAYPVIYAYSDERLHLFASAAGFSSRATAVDLALGDRKSLDLNLEPLATGNADLTTDPVGAAISLDSVPIGLSPLSIGLDGSRRIVLAQAQGRESQTVILPESGDVQLNLDLPPTDGLGPKGRILAAKDSFYKTFGWFVLSIPVTALTYGINNAYDEAYTRSGEPSLYGSAQISTYALWTAAAATGTAAVFMIIRLVKYLSTAH